MRFIHWLTIALDIGVFSKSSVDGTFPSQMELNETEYEYGEYGEYGEADLPTPTDDIQPLSITGGQEDLPTLPEAVQLFQLESMNELRQTIQSQESVIRDQETRIAELEKTLEDKDLLIVSMTAEGRREKAQCETEKARLREDFAAEKEEEREQCDAEIAKLETEETQVREELAAKNKKEKKECEAEKERYVMEKTQLAEECAAQKVEEKEQCEAQKTQLRAEFANQILENEAKCEEARMEVEIQTNQESERMGTKLHQCKSTIIYMGNVMLQNNQGMLEGQRLLEAQANTIKEANEEINRQRDSLFICEAAANSTVLQAETIALLRSSINSTLNLPRLSTSDLEQLDVDPFMLEMSESYIRQKNTIENLNAVLEKGNTLEERMFEVAEGLTNLASTMKSTTVNLNIVDQQAYLIQNQAKSIAQLTPLLKHTSDIWYEKSGAGETGSVSSCSCLPTSADSTRPSPTRIEYHCGDLSDRTFSLSCSGGVCEAEALPSCTEPIEWEESVVALQHCQETPFNGDTLFCSHGGNGTREMKTTSNIGGGVVEEVSIVPCLSCIDLLTWTDWEPCTDQVSERKVCRQRGDDMIGFEKEMAEEGELEPETAIQSSTHQEGDGRQWRAGNCIDGNTGSDHVDGRLAICHTNREPAPWIAIDYGSSVTVQRVEIFNRGGAGQRTRNVDVRISNRLPTSHSQMFSGGTLLGHFDGPATDGQLIVVSGQEMSGRYVIVQMNQIDEPDGGDILNLREVKAFGRLPLTGTSSTSEDSLLFITGGFDGNSRLSSTEIYPRSSNCSPPSLPVGRSGHTTFMTSEPGALIATCGGVYTASCLVLDQVNQRWEESRMGNLTMWRKYAAVARLNYIGVFLLGGQNGYYNKNQGTSEFLASGTMQWQEGPALPVDMALPCAVPISPSSFLVVHGTDIREFDTSIAGPTASEGWLEAGRWPTLKASRSNQPGCAKIGRKVIIAGGGEGLRSTEVLDIVNRQITSGGEMATPRRNFHVATIRSGGQKRLFALAGWDGSSTRLASVEEWTGHEWIAGSGEADTLADNLVDNWGVNWANNLEAILVAHLADNLADNLVVRRAAFGAVTVPRQLICPA